MSEQVSQRTGVQPPRGEKDGAVSVNRSTDGTLFISATHGGEERSLTVSEYNAWRIFGMLALFLEVPLPKKLGKSIQFGEVSGSIAVPHDGTLGGKVAAALAATRVEEALQKAEGVAAPAGPKVRRRRK